MSVTCTQQVLTPAWELVWILLGGREFEQKCSRRVPSCYMTEGCFQSVLQINISSHVLLLSAFKDCVSLILYFVEQTSEYLIASDR